MIFTGISWDLVSIRFAVDLLLISIRSCFLFSLILVGFGLIWLGFLSIIVLIALVAL